MLPLALLLLALLLLLLALLLFALLPPPLVLPLTTRLFPSPCLSLFRVSAAHSRSAALFIVRHGRNVAVCACARGRSQIRVSSVRRPCR